MLTNTLISHLVPPYMSSERGLRFVFPHRGDRRYCYASPTDGGWCCGATCQQHCLVQTPGVHHKLLSHTLAPSAGEHRYMCPCFSSCWKLEIFLLSSSSLSDFCQPLPRKIRVQGHCISYFLAGSEFKPGKGEVLLQAFVGHVSNTSVS